MDGQASRTRAVPPAAQRTVPVRAVTASAGPGSPTGPTVQDSARRGQLRPAEEPFAGRDLEAEWCAAWVDIHSGVEKALRGLPVDHPRRAVLFSLLADAAETAQLPAAPYLRSVSPA